MVELLSIVQSIGFRVFLTSDQYNSALQSFLIICTLHILHWLPTKSLLKDLKFSSRCKAFPAVNSRSQIWHISAVRRNFRFSPHFPLAHCVNSFTWSLLLVTQSTTKAEFPLWDFQAKIVINEQTIWMKPTKISYINTKSNFPLDFFSSLSSRHRHLVPIFLSFFPPLFVVTSWLFSFIHSFAFLVYVFFFSWLSTACRNSPTLISQLFTTLNFDGLYDE